MVVGSIGKIVWERNKDTYKDVSVGTKFPLKWERQNSRTHGKELILEGKMIFFSSEVTITLNNYFLCYNECEWRN